jgi:O-antigen ligase
MWKKLFIVWVLLLPFIVCPWIFEGAKIFWFWLGGFFLTLLWLVSLRTKLPKIITNVDYWYFSWLSVLLISSTFGIHPLNSIIGGSYRHQGVIFFFTLWLVGKTVFMLSQKQKEVLTRMFSFGVFIESLLIISQNFVGSILPLATIDGRPLGTFGEPNAAAGFLAIGTVFLSDNVMGKGGSFGGFFGSISLLLIFLAIIFTESRAAILTFLVVLLGIFVIRLVSRTGKLHKRKMLLKVWLPALLLVILVSLFIIKSVSLTRLPSDIEDRRVFWKLGWSAILEKPVFGYGAESGEVVYEEKFSEAALPLYELIVDRSHNLFLDVAMWSGFVGLVLFSGWLITALNNLAKERKWINVVGVLGWLVFSMFQPLGVVHWVLLVLILNW